jgi:SAM-dependent methyltransferase
MDEGTHARQGGPDRAAAVEQYRHAAPEYDTHMKRFARWQRLAVERLELQIGDTVLDIGCGTGLAFPLLEERIGEEGRIVGIELSREMLEQARSRVAEEGWQNVMLVEAAAEGAEFATAADAALFSFTHDVLQSPLAVANVIAHTKAGARVACVGAKLAKRGPIVNYFVRRSARPYMTTFSGLDRPWWVLERYTTEVKVRSLALGGAYVYAARVREGAPEEAATQLSSEHSA